MRIEKLKNPVKAAISSGAIHKKAAVMFLIVWPTTIHSLLKLPYWDYPMYGDDYLGIRVATMPIRDGSFLENLLLVGGGKWRPITTSLILFTGAQSGFSYPTFQIASSGLLVACAFLASFICFRVSRNFMAAVTVSTLTVVSQFNWFSQVSIYGLMELTAIMFLLLSVWPILESETLLDPRLAVKLSTVFLLCATLTHERYIICTFPIVVFFLIKQRTTEMKNLPWLPLLIPMFHIVMKSFVFQLDPLTGGGERQMSGVGETWMIVRLLDSLRMLLGWFSGVGHYYNGDRLGKLARSSDLGVPAFVVSFLSLMIVGLAWIQVYRHSRRNPVVARPNLGSIFAIAIALACLLPSATVFERIEGRWMFGSQILLSLGVATMLRQSATSRTWIRIASVIVPLTMTGTALMYLPDADAYTTLRNQPTEILSQLSDRSPQDDPWAVVIVQADETVPTKWQFGYGDALMQLPNPPYYVNISHDGNSICPKFRIRMTCLMVKVDGIDSKFEILERQSVPVVNS